MSKPTGVGGHRCPSHFDAPQPLRFWLRDETTWLELARSGATNPRRVAAVARRLWPNRPPTGVGLKRAYRWSELKQIAAVLRQEVS